MTADDLRRVYLGDIARTFQNYKALGERAVAQVSDEDLHRLVDPEANSIAIVFKHLAGDLRSRFTNFLTTDGEKPTRNRDGEFEMPERMSRDEMLAAWESSWAVALAAIRGSHRGSRPNDLHPRRSISGRRGAEPPGHARGLPRRSDCLSRQTLRRTTLDVADHPEESVGGCQGRVQEGHRSRILSGAVRLREGSPCHRFRLRLDQLQNTSANPSAEWTYYAPLPLEAASARLI